MVSVDEYAGVLPCSSFVEVEEIALAWVERDSVVPPQFQRVQDVIRSSPGVSRRLSTGLEIGEIVCISRIRRCGASREARPRAQHEND